MSDYNTNITGLFESRKLFSREEILAKKMKRSNEGSADVIDHFGREFYLDVEGTRLLTPFYSELEEKFTIEKNRKDEIREFTPEKIVLSQNEEEKINTLEYRDIKLNNEKKLMSNDVKKCGENLGMDKGLTEGDRRDTNLFDVAKLSNTTTNDRNLNLMFQTVVTEINTISPNSSFDNTNTNTNSNTNTNTHSNCETIVQDHISNTLFSVNTSIDNLRLNTVDCPKNICETSTRIDTHTPGHTPLDSSSKQYRGQLHLGGWKTSFNAYPRLHQIGLIVNCARMLDIHQAGSPARIAEWYVDSARLARSGCSYLRLNWHDKTFQSLWTHFLWDDLVCAVNTIHIALEKGVNVLVHCRKGRSRSASVVAAYLMARRGFTSKEAIDWMKDRRPSVSMNRGFKKQLKIFENSEELKKLRCSIGLDHVKEREKEKKKERLQELKRKKEKALKKMNKMMDKNKRKHKDKEKSKNSSNGGDSDSVDGLAVGNINVLSHSGNEGIDVKGNRNVVMSERWLFEGICTVTGMVNSVTSTSGSGVTSTSTFTSVTSTSGSVTSSTITKEVDCIIGVTDFSITSFGTESDSDSDSNSDRDRNNDSDRDGNIDTDIDTDIDTESDSESENESENDSDSESESDNDHRIRRRPRKLQIPTQLMVNGKLQIPTPLTGRKNTGISAITQTNTITSIIEPIGIQSSQEAVLIQTQTIPEQTTSISTSILVENELKVDVNTQMSVDITMDSNTPITLNNNTGTSFTTNPSITSIGTVNSNTPTSIAFNPMTVQTPITVQKPLTPVVSVCRCMSVCYC